MILPIPYRCSGVHCGIKSDLRNDLGLIVCEEDVIAAGCYTRNIVRAACIDYNRAITPTDSCRAVVINSGNANACTGTEGESNCRRTAEYVADKLGCRPNQILVLSTGVIGVQLPMQKIKTGISNAVDRLSQSVESFGQLSESMLTTDRFEKTASAQISTDIGVVNLLGVAKGAGMIGPNMATMLAIILTDAVIAPENAQKILRHAVNASFNRISVDGHTSTNDAVIMLARNPAVSNSDLSCDEDLLQNELENLCIELAKKIPLDGEGATRLIEITCTGCATDADADQICRTVAASNLVKTAVHGCDPNWGRIVSAAGYAGVSIAPDHISLTINDHRVFHLGTPDAFDETVVSQSMKLSPVCQIGLVVGQGTGNAIHWSSDLTKSYVELNSDYRT